MNIARLVFVILIAADSAPVWADADEDEGALSVSEWAELIGSVVAPLLASVAAGFVLNRFVLGRRVHGRWRAAGLAASRAIFYAPSLVDVGHGVYFPYPLLVTLAYAGREFGPELDMAAFVLPVVVFLGSLAFAGIKTWRHQQTESPRQ